MLGSFASLANRLGCWQEFGHVLVQLRQLFSTMSDLAGPRPDGQGAVRNLGLSKHLVIAILATVATALVLAACGRSGLKSGSNYSKRVIALGKPVPKGGGAYKVGKPYQINGRWFYPREDSRYDKVGVASWYGDLFHGRYTANGEIYDMNALSAAHPTLPLPIYARVTNLSNGRNLVVRVNDRGPYAHDRIIDMSKRSAELLGFKRNGTARVRVQYMARAPISGDDTYERQMLASQRWARTAGLIGPPRSSAAPAWRPVAKNTSQQVSPKVAEAPLSLDPRSAIKTAQKKTNDAPEAFRKAAREPFKTAEQKTQQPAKAAAAMETTKQAIEPRIAASAADPIVTGSIPQRNEDAGLGQETLKKRKIYIQSGAFKMRDNAERLRLKLSSIGEAEITAATIDGTIFHRVRLGPFAARELADATLDDVVRAGASGASIVSD